MSGSLVSAWAMSGRCNARLGHSLPGLKSQSVEMLKNQGDREMCSKNYDNAISLYSAALTIPPAALQAATLFVKRSKARTASCSCEDALKDADEVRTPAVVVALCRISRLVSIRRSD